MFQVPLVVVSNSARMKIGCTGSYLIVRFVPSEFVALVAPRLYTGQSHHRDLLINWVMSRAV
jgi:hypothetical protein